MPDALDDALQISFDALPLDDETESSSGERFRVVDVEGEERISGLFKYEVIFEEPIADSEGEVRAAPALPIDELTGTDVTLSFHRRDSTVRYVNGIVGRLVHEHTSGLGAAADRQRYRVEICPELWLLTLTNDFRAFSDKAVPDIVATILDDYQISYDEDSLDENLKDQYRSRGHVLQSGESTFEFVDGLLEEAGIFYFFRQHAGFHTIVFGDDNTAFPDAPLEGENAPALRMGTSDQNDEETLWTGALEENVVPDGHRIGDTHFDGSTVVHQREEGDGDVDRKGRPLDVVNYPGGANRSADDTPREHGPDILRRRLQQHRSSKRLLRGISPVRGLGTGQIFELIGHDHGPINGTEFVTRRLFVEASSADGYRVEYEAFPASARFRGYRYTELKGPKELGKAVRPLGSDNSSGAAPKTLPPQLQNDPQFNGEALSLHLAKVVDATGSKSGPKKKKGKVKVDFDWNKKGNKKGSSDEVWVRLTQFSASPSGQSWGSQFVPRPGAKVLVAHEQGVTNTSDMDPIVLGCLYQGGELPYPNDGKTENYSSIRTHSEREEKKVVHNEIRFVDEKDNEEFGTFAPHKRVDAAGFEEDVQDMSQEIAKAAAKRVEYTGGDPEENGVLQACNGSYRIHAHGPRLEIYRADAGDGTTASDFFSQEFDQEFDEAWSPEGPDELERFEGEDNSPIVMLNKGGGISIRSTDGVNIESKGDVNIQSGGSIKMRAKNNIECYADNEYTQYGRDMTIGERKGEEGTAIDLSLKSKNYKNKTKIANIDAVKYDENSSFKTISSAIKTDKQEVESIAKKVVNTDHKAENSKSSISNSQFAVTNQQAGFSNAEKYMSLTIAMMSSSNTGLKSDKAMVVMEDKDLEMKNRIASLEKGVSKLDNEVFKKAK